MRQVTSILRLLTIVGLFASITGSALAAGTPEAGADPSVFVRQVPGLGTILTDPAGKTLYLFTKDTTASQSVCADDCATNWPAFTSDEPLTLPGGVDGELTSFDRADGTKQVAYNGIPLYYFAGDAAVGDANGQGKGGVWFVVAPGAQFGQGAPTVLVGQSDEYGPYLTDAKGMSLYLFTKDTAASQSSCEGDCATNWPAFTADEPLILPAGVDGELTTFDRSDGTKQVAYNGIPLYYFAGDAAAGDTNGQEKGDVWYLVAPGSQFGVVATPEASPSADNTSVDITVQEFTIMASQTEFKVGVEYTFNVTNAGQMQHEFVIEKAGDNDVPLVEVDPMDGGASGSVTYTFTEAGNYQFACHVMDHYPMGVALTIHVTE